MATRSYSTFLVGLSAVLLLGTSGAALAQSKSLTGSVGAIVFALPAYASAPGVVVAGTASVDGQIDVDPAGVFNGQINFSLWSAFGSGNNTTTQTFSGPGVLVVPGYSTPSGTISLVTNSNGAGNSLASSDITHTPNSQNVHNTGGNGLSDLYGVVSGTGAADPSFLYGGIFTSGPANQAGAFGAIAAPDGGVFVASGDLTGLTLTNSVTRNVVYAGGDITLGLGASDTGDTKISGFVGPSFKLLGQDIVTATTVDIPERTTNGADTFPLYVDTRTEDLNSFYYGGLAGINLSHAVSSDVTVNFGGKVGLYAVNTSFRGGETYAANGQTITFANGPSASDMGMAYALALNGGVSKKITEKMDFGVNLGADFLSRVATLTSSPNTPTTTGTLSGDDGTIGYDGATAQTFKPVLTFGSMITWRATASLTGHF